MAKMCNLCGSIAYMEQDMDFPVCSASGRICVDNVVDVQDGFVEVIKILQQKGYIIIEYNQPRMDAFETDYMTTIVFSLHTVPETKPPLYRIKLLPEVYGVVFRHDFDPEDYKGQVKRGALILKRTAEKLPAIGFTKL